MIIQVNPLQLHQYKYCLYFSYQQAVQKGEPPGIILRLAQKLSFSPAMLAKVLLEHYLNLIAEQDDASTSVGG